MARQTLIRSTDRGHTKISWLDSKHSFSFGNYRNPERDQFRTLRVFNDDIVTGGGGFDTHPHKNMEIVTYVLSGELAHKDSLGSEQILHPGEVQRMSAGTGILHGEWNASEKTAVHFLQIWILPKTSGDTPRYEQQKIIDTGALSLLASRDGRNGSLIINQECDIFRLSLDSGATLSYAVPTDEAVYIHIIDGVLDVVTNDGTSEALSSGDALGLENLNTVTLTAKEGVHALFFQLL